MSWKKVFQLWHELQPEEKVKDQHKRENKES